LWTEAPQIWRDIKATKSEEDLKRILTTTWSRRFQGDLNIMAHDIHFVKELLEALRKVELVASSQATFLTAESGLLILNLMPRSRAEMARIDSEQRLRDATASTATFAEAKKA
jgi:hypothetical protein